MYGVGRPMDKEPGRQKMYAYAKRTTYVCENRQTKQIHLSDGPIKDLIQPTKTPTSSIHGDLSRQAVHCWADETLEWSVDSRVELAIRKPAKLISLPLMHLIAGLEERGSYVRYYTVLCWTLMRNFCRLIDSLRQHKAQQSLRETKPDP